MANERNTALTSHLYCNQLSIFQNYRIAPTNIHLVITKLSKTAIENEPLYSSLKRKEILLSTLIWVGIKYTLVLFGLWILSFPNKKISFLCKRGWVLLCACPGYWLKERWVNAVQFSHLQVKVKVISGWAGRVLRCNIYFQRETLAKCRCWSPFWPLWLVPVFALAPFYAGIEKSQEVKWYFSCLIITQHGYLAHSKRSSVQRNQCFLSQNASSLWLRDSLYILISIWKGWSWELFFAVLTLL